MNKMTRLILFVAFLGFSGLTVAQTSQKLDHTELMNELKGTYQIQVVNARFKPALNTESYLLIRDSRKENEDVIITLTENIRVLVLSENKIVAGDLIEESSEVIYTRQ